MNKSVLDASESTPVTFRWRWFLLGCSCLLLGGSYLAFADIGVGTTAADGPSEKTQFTSKGSESTDVN